MQVLRKAFGDETVLLDVDAHDLPTVFDQAVDFLADKGFVEEGAAERVKKALAERESKASTAIGHAVAVPHAYLDALRKPTVCFVRLRHPVNLGAPDGVPTQFIFFLLGPPSAAPAHLDTLATIARLMADEEFRYHAGAARTTGELIAALDAFDARTAPPEARVAPEAPVGMRWTGRPFGGIRQDIARRLPHYLADLRDGLNTKCVGSTLFLFFACLAPAITFGGLMAEGTGGADPNGVAQIGAAEMLLATAVCGVVYALFAGQPLIILGGTGPLLVVTVILYGLCKDWGTPFLPAYAWVGLWSALFVALLGVFDASCLMRYFTRFTDEVFAALISLIFIYEALHSLGQPFNASGIRPGTDHDMALLSVILGLGTFYVAMSLARFRRSSYLLPWMREFLADFGPTIALGLMTFVAVFWLDEVSLRGLEAPEVFGPTADRDWLVDIWAAPASVRWAAAGPALLVAVLIYLDQNITARLVNSPDHRLRRGPGYHLDLLVVGGLMAFCSLFGLPWLVAATVRSLNHVRSLATFEEVVTRTGAMRERIIHVRENRLTGLAIHVLVGCSLLLLPLLSAIPLAVLYGVFLFMGVVSIAGNQFFERLSLWFKDPDLYPAFHYIRRAPIWTIHAFTLIQVICLGILWVVKTSDQPAIAILFPLFIALLVPVRILLVGQWFKAEHLRALDAEEEPEDEATHWAG